VPTRTDAMKPSGCVVIDTTVQPKAVMFPIDRSFSRCRRSSGMCCACLEPVIDHIKEDHLMGRNYLAHANGDGINAVLAPPGYNFRRPQLPLPARVFAFVAYNPDALGLGAQLKLAEFEFSRTTI
jgi:hypothetical protein